MDSLTHLLMGHAMGMFVADATPAIQAGAYWGALIGNSLPHLDVPVGYLMGKGWALHRKFTHTIPGVLLLSATVSAVISLAIPGSSPQVTFGWTLAGCIVHVLLDCLNLFGTSPFWPFSERRVGLGILFIVDPLILAALGLGSIAQLTGWIGAGLLRWLYGVTWLYIGARWILRALVIRKVAGPGVVRSTLTPWFLGWRFTRETVSGLEQGQIGFLGRITS